MGFNMGFKYLSTVRGTYPCKQAGRLAIGGLHAGYLRDATRTNTGTRLAGVRQVHPGCPKSAQILLK